MDTKQLVGERIKALRMKKGLTQEELAEVVGINPKYLSGIERGRENPTFNILITVWQIHLKWISRRCSTCWKAKTRSMTRNMFGTCLTRPAMIKAS